jgi:hypothetical protein
LCPPGRGPPSQQRRSASGARPQLSSSTGPNHRPTPRLVEPRHRGHRARSGARGFGTSPDHTPHALSALVIRPYETFRHLRRTFSAGNATSTRNAGPAHPRTCRQRRGPAPTWDLPPCRRSEQAASSPGAPVCTPSGKPPRATHTPPGRAPSTLRRVGRTRSPTLQQPPLGAPRRLHGGTSASTTLGASPGPSSPAVPHIEDIRQAGAV